MWCKEKVDDMALCAFTRKFLFIAYTTHFT
jgi:hypothetical protein